MSKIIEINFGENHRSREEFLVVLADAITETFGNLDPADGPFTAADLLDVEAETRTADGETLMNAYRTRVGAVCAAPGAAIDLDACLDPNAHARGVQWARDCLKRVNESFGLNLGARA